MANHQWMSGEEHAPQMASSGRVQSPYALDPSYLPPAPEFIFPIEKKKRSWNEKMFERTGTSYICGHIAGGSWGFYEGLSKPEGRTTRLRMNSILNGVTRRGPFVGNTAASLALMYSPLESVIGHIRGVEDNSNSIAAAGITGLLYKSTAGLRSMGVASAAGCTVLGFYIGALYLLGRKNSSLLFS